ncbi:MAG: hypothetical protein AABZ11_02445 [Nitrospinota bacterium]|jgi:hypothetical protein
MVENLEIPKVVNQILTAKSARLKAQIEAGIKKDVINQQKIGGKHLIKLIKGSKIDIRI